MIMMIKCGNYEQWLSLDRFSPHVEMYYTRISRLTSNVQGKTLLSRFASTALCIPLLQFTHTVDNTVSVATLHQVPRYMMYYFFLFFFMFEHLNSLFLRHCSRLFWTSSISSSSPLQSTYPTGGWSRRPCRVLLLLLAGFRVLVSSSVSQL